MSRSQGLLKDCYSTTGKLYNTVQHKIMKTLTMLTFLDGAQIAERLLFNY